MACKKRGTVVSEKIIRNGITYYRYPESSKFERRMYFTASCENAKKGFTKLHRDIWKEANGEIPEGFIVHHKDGNTLNNDISNLGLISRSKHISLHNSLWSDERIKKQREAMLKAQKIRAEYQRTTKGREETSKTKKRSWEKRKQDTDGWNESTCSICGGSFKSLLKTARFCSKECFNAHRRESRRAKIEKKWEQLFQE